MCAFSLYLFGYKSEKCYWDPNPNIIWAEFPFYCSYDFAWKYVWFFDLCFFFRVCVFFLFFVSFSLFCFIFIYRNFGIFHSIPNKKWMNFPNPCSELISRFSRSPNNNIVIWAHLRSDYPSWIFLISQIESKFRETLNIFYFLLRLKNVDLHWHISRKITIYKLQFYQYIFDKLSEFGKWRTIQLIFVFRFTYFQCLKKCSHKKWENVSAAFNVIKSTLSQAWIPFYIEVGKGRCDRRFRNV